MLKLSDNPLPRLAHRESIRDIPGDWFVGHCRSRLEKAFAHDLSRIGIDYYLPMVMRTTFSGGRKRKGMYPLFPSYVFFAGNEETRIRALHTDRLSNVIPVRNQIALINELSGLEKALSSDLTIDLYRHIAIGQRCRIKSGPMEGVTGVIVSRANLVTFVVQISLLQQGAAMDIDGDLLEPLSD